MSTNSQNIELAARNFRQKLVDLANDPHVHMTIELVTELNGIVNGLDSLKLDSMFLANSPNWQANFVPKLAHDQYHISGLLVEGEALLYELRCNMASENLASLPSNQVASMNYVAKQKLRAFLKQLHPYTHQSYVRIDNYAQELGIRDRFANVRNELIEKNLVNRPGPLQNWTNWTDKAVIEAPKYNTPNFRNYKLGLSHYETGDRRFENKASSTNKNQSGFFFQQEQKYNVPMYSDACDNETLVMHTDTPTDYSVVEVQTLRRDAAKTRPKTVGATVGHHHHRSETSRVDPNRDWKRLAHEAGINTEFPGSTEQKTQYTRPRTSNYKNFVMNPQMEFGRLNRPFTAATLYPLSTEYQSNYRIPDGNLIDKLPWVKQC